MRAQAAERRRDALRDRAGAAVPTDVAVVEDEAEAVERRRHLVRLPGPFTTREERGG